MQYLNIQVQDHMAIVGLNKEPSNALDSIFLDELSEALDQIEKEASVAGMIVHGREGFFSSGLDLIELYEYNSLQIRSFWIKYFKLIKRFTAFKKPAIAAINGHCPAGGCLLALCCDYRIMQNGEFVIGLNQIPVGIIVTESFFELLRYWIGSGNAYKCLMEGRLMSPQEALKIGIVDEVIPERDLRRSAEKKLKELMSMDTNTWQQSKLNIRESLIRSLSVPDDRVLESILEQWWSPSARSILKTIIENFKST